MMGGQNANAIIIIIIMSNAAYYVRLASSRMRSNGSNHEKLLSLWTDWSGRKKNWTSLSLSQSPPSPLYHTHNHILICANREMLNQFEQQKKRMYCIVHISVHIFHIPKHPKEFLYAISLMLLWISFIAYWIIWALISADSISYSFEHINIICRLLYEPSDELTRANGHGQTQRSNNEFSIKSKTIFFSLINELPFVFSFNFGCAFGRMQHHTNRDTFGLGH